MTVWLPRSKRDVATWVISDMPTGAEIDPPQVEVAGVLYAATVDLIPPPVEDPDAPVRWKVSLGVCGPEFEPPRAGEAVITDDVLALVVVDGIARTDEWIRLTG